MKVFPSEKTRPGSVLEPNNEKEVNKEMSPSKLPDEFR